jgi:hypothetical protein
MSGRWPGKRLYPLTVADVGLGTAGTLLILAGVVLFQRRVSAGPAIAMWSPFVQRAVTNGRMSPDQLRRSGLYIAMVGAAFLALAGAVLVVASVGRA